MRTRSFATPKDPVWVRPAKPQQVLGGIFRSTVLPQRSKDGVKEPTHAGNHDDRKIPKQMGRIRMPHRNPQRWFSHGGPPYGRIKKHRLSDDCPGRDIHVPTRPPVVAPVKSTNRSLSCVVLCHPSQRKKVGPSTQVSVTRVTSFRSCAPSSMRECEPKCTEPKNGEQHRHGNA